MNDTMEQFAYQIGPEEDDERLDKWMSSAIADLSRSYIQKCIKDNQVLINGKPQKASYRLKVDDEIVFHFIYIRILLLLDTTLRTLYFTHSQH